MKRLAFICLSLLVFSVCGAAESGQKQIYITGYIRGRSKTTLKNKYSGFVRKVNFYSQSRVKKGDVILEYDDWDLRSRINKKQAEIKKQQQVVELKKIALKITEINPLSSEWRNLTWKCRAAEEGLKRSTHELEVYQKLYKSKSISDLALREKRQEQADYAAELAALKNDVKIVSHGLAELYIQRAKVELQEAEAALEVLKKELGSLEEERKYFKIVAPHDGLCITDSDTINGYYAAGTVNASVHRDAQKRLYAMARAEDLPFIKENTVYRFYSNQYGHDSKLVFEAKLYKIDRTRHVYGDGSYYQCKFDMITEPQPLRVDSIGSVVISVPGK